MQLDQTNSLDFRSDTVTKPTPEMREAMYQAAVGDDVYGEDPSINMLQELAADMTGKEAALFVPSGTMGNLASILSHCKRGEEIIVGRKAHIFLFEAAGASALGGVNINTIPNQPDGKLSLEDIEQAIRPDDVHQPITKLVAMENTHNRCNGASLSQSYTENLAEYVHSRGLKLHIDGARIFNAAVDQNISVKNLASPADSITFCLSKGLSAPVGSLICGSQEFIKTAHRVRKQLGGGMRQAGIVAAAGIVALESMTDRLRDDHRRAKSLAQGLSTIPQVVIELENQHTNMVYFSLEPELGVSLSTLRNSLHEKGLFIGGGSDRIRMVTHYWITDASVQQALELIEETIVSLKKN
ncbi:MAG TPA: low-specificity L-threonine aldolase [Anaerolineales bacterium]|nr:low-specificity L-threonine aldolase [Anaerolineales bacterium]